MTLPPPSRARYKVCAEHTRTGPSRATASKQARLSTRCAPSPWVAPSYMARRGTAYPTTTPRRRRHTRPFSLLILEHITMRVRKGEGGPQQSPQAFLTTSHLVGGHKHER